MKPLDLSIRADGDSEIGLGHITRCISLAHMLADDFNIRFFCARITEPLAEEIRANGWELSSVGGETDFLEPLGGNNIVVLDGYHFNPLYQKAIKSKHAKLVCIDDLCSHDFYADLIINHAPGVKPEHYKAMPYTRFALGHEFALLRPAFLRQARQERKIKKIESLLICFGGSDPKNFTRKALEIALQFPVFQKIYVVTGSANMNIDTLTPVISANKERTDHFHAVSAEQMMALMLQGEVAIVPASGILFEALACGNIVLSGYYVDNQKAIFDGFRDLEAIVSVQGFDADSLISGLRRVLNGDYPLRNNCIDGKSDHRILNYFKSLAA